MKRLISILLAAVLTAGLAAAPLAAETGFSDVPANAWYAEAAAFCRESGLIAGTGGGRFSPAVPVTRGMLAAVLYRLSGRRDRAGETAFPDLTAESWCLDAAAWAVRVGILEQYPDGTFRPDEAVSRQRLVLAIWRYAGEPGCDPGEDFSDESEIEPEAAAAVDWARASGIVSGESGGRFAPEKTASRAALAVILQRLSCFNGMGATCAPSGIVLAEDGSFLVTDTSNKVLWRTNSGASAVYAGKITTLGLYGEPVGGYNDSEVQKSFFREPWAIAPFLDGYAVSDAANNAVRLVRTIRVETVNGSTRESLKTSDLGVTFQRPTGLAADEAGNLYVSDTLNDAVRKISPEGQVSTAARNLQQPTGLCWKDGSLYIAETGANRVVKLTDGRIVPVAGSGAADLADGDAARAAFNAPQGVAVGDDGTVYVSDTVNGAVRRIKDGRVDTLLSRDRSGQDFYPVSPMGLALKDGALYVCDNFARKILVIELQP